jgi:hypothetical protein
MPAKELKELRQAGKLEEAYELAQKELSQAIDSFNQTDVEEILKSKKYLMELEGKIFDYDLEKASVMEDLLNSHVISQKRNISWVYYDYLKQNNSPDNFVLFIYWLNEIKKLRLSIEEGILFEQLNWQVGKMAFSLIKSNPQNHNNGIQLFEAIQSLLFPKPSEGYSFLFKALHKCLKESVIYTQFADWWDFKNFRPEDFQKDKMPNGKEIMAIAEQAYIAYAKHLLPKKGIDGSIIFNKEKTLAFLPLLEAIVENYPQYQYPGYFQAKLLLALGDNADHILAILLPFVKRKKNDFWAWDVLSEVFPEEQEKVIACYCKALSLRSPEEMLVNLRQRMATIFINKNLFNEAKTEIENLSAARVREGWALPNIVNHWKQQEWYKTAQAKKSNVEYYAQYTHLADELLYSDKPEETVIVDFVNSDRKMLNFIASESKFGFFKYERFLSDVKVGDILKVRFQGGSCEGMHQIYTAIKVNDDAFKIQFVKELIGVVSIPKGKPFGFMDDVFIHPSLVTKYKLTDGMQFTGKAIKSYNQEKKQWGWKLL